MWGDLLGKPSATCGELSGIWDSFLPWLSHHFSSPTFLYMSRLRYVKRTRLASSGILADVVTLSVPCISLSSTHFIPEKSSVLLTSLNMGK